MDVFRSEPPIHSNTIADGVYSRIRQAIVTGELEPGLHLVEATLAKTLQVSRTPLREAFRRLERERLLERIPHGGVRVALTTAAELEHLADVRVTLECLAVRKAAERVRAGALGRNEMAIFDQLEQLLSDMQRSMETSRMLEYLAQGREFHRCIYQMSGNPWCEHVMGQVLDALERYRSRRSTERHSVAIEEHRAIMDAVKNGDPERAEMLMSAHLSSGRQLHRREVAASDEAGTEA